MSIEEQLATQMKTAMRARDKKTLGLIRMLKSKMGERTTAAGFEGEVDDKLWLEVITAYAKSQKKAIAQFEKAGEAGKGHIEELSWELAYLDQFLPKKADEATVRIWVQEAIDGMGAGNAKMGPVMGLVMKAHKAEVDAQMVRAIVQELLS